ncbi:uncharacterized protein LY79DRAFT_513684 [Colletotrichum navitas]|uniref:Nephrocystin 3-like N-terminal domain-containing protein n=1 Tax=Colletotrichum navitas TaxID=681940 RepID=A0AAD8Q1T0_9PEZI|nr:uncharacterized protein LY79DRAFT_513684 [Colletotrichum navitas]KAK1593786.1 hypothetical protein LY79DRAFT_513684 [Colletotrichum navitas]
MAESLAALGVAANIVQFLELGLKAAVSIVEIYRSVNDDGWTARNADLDSMAKDLRDLCDRLKKDADVKLDPAMERLLQRCIDTADELSLELRRLVGEIATRYQKWAKFKISLAAYFKRGKIDEVRARLVEIRTRVFEHLQILLHDNRISLSKSMRCLEETSEAWNRTTEKRLNALAHDLSNLCQSQSVAAASTEGLRIFSETWARVAEDAQNQATVVAILTSLKFTQIKERQSEIPKAHRRTFEWVFSDDTPVRLSAWLRGSSGLFWITGKPGSGKSTLMKFILSHEHTMFLAKDWASPEPLIVASHFFWSAGTTIQKSQEGLLRTLLFQILVNCPELIPSVCPTRYSSPFKRLESWSIEELSEAFGRLKDIRPLPSRILLLIDGLDEYNGNLGDLVQFLRSASDSPYIKTCCASRPWPVFTNGFENVSGRIYMHELTANDMRRYTRDTLNQHSHFKMLKRSQKLEASNLVKEIAERSEGVFFWVSLVVRSLLRGLDNGDDVAILQQRLSEFPSDLDKFFQRMLDTIDSVYKDRAAMVFSMLLLANSSLPLVVFVELDRLVAAMNEYGNRHEAMGSLSGGSLLRTKHSRHDSRAHVLSEFLLKDAGSLPDNLKRYQQHDLSVTKIKRRKDQILAQCRDLVQAWEVAGPYGLQHNLRLGFLHRTVVEFLLRAAENQWRSTLPFERYLLARSFLGFIEDGSVTRQWTREFVLRFLYTLQGADLQETVESRHLTVELLYRLLWYIHSNILPGMDVTFLDQIGAVELLLRQAVARTLIDRRPEALQSFEVWTDLSKCHPTSLRLLPWYLCDSGYVEVGEWAQVSWPRVVDLEVLEYLLNHQLIHYIHRHHPFAFSTLLVTLSNEKLTRPRNDLQVCKMLIEHGLAGPAEANKPARSRGMSPAQVMYESASDSALTQSSTIEWLRLNRVFSESGLRELEEAFPLESAPTPMTLLYQKEREERSKVGFLRRLLS